MSKPSARHLLYRLTSRSINGDAQIMHGVLLGGSGELQRMALLLGQDGLTYEVRSCERLRREYGQQRLDELTAECAQFAASGQLTSAILAMPDMSFERPIRQAVDQLARAERRLAYTLHQASEAGTSLRDLAELTGRLSHERVRQMVREEQERQGEGINLGWAGRGMPSGRLMTLIAAKDEPLIERVTARLRSEYPELTVALMRVGDAERIAACNADVILVDWMGTSAKERVKLSTNSVAMNGRGRWLVHLLPHMDPGRSMPMALHYYSALIVADEGRTIIKDYFALHQPAA
jgi:hypothetical protein